MRIESQRLRPRDDLRPGNGIEHPALMAVREARDWGVQLVPYIEHMGAWIIDDYKVMAAFDGLVADGTLETTFPSGDIDSPDDFLIFAKSRGTMMTFLYTEEQLAGFAWLSHLQQGWALGNFALLKRVWGPESLIIGRALLNLWFHMERGDAPVFETIGGVTPSDNRRALAYIKRLGFTLVGNLPVGETGMTISYLTQDQFYGRRQ